VHSFSVSGEMFCQIFGFWVWNWPAIFFLFSLSCFLAELQIRQLQERGAETKKDGKQFFESQKCLSAEGFIVHHASFAVSTNMLDRFQYIPWGLQI
jgi:hypothetical protein